MSLVDDSDVSPLGRGSGPKRPDNLVGVQSYDPQAPAAFWQSDVNIAPYTSLLAVQGNDRGSAVKAGKAIVIHPRFALTAAHTIAPRAREVFDTIRIKTVTGVQDMQPSKFWLHQDWDGAGGSVHDLGLIEFAQELPLPALRIYPTAGSRLGRPLRNSL